jgi:hypothetical protein
LQPSIGTNVEQFMAALDQNAPDEQAAVAVGRVFFAAKQRNAKFRDAAFQPLDSSSKSAI